MIFKVIHVLKIYKQNTYLILLRLLLLDMLLVYYLLKTKLCSKNLKRLTYKNAFMINILKNNCKTDLEYQLGNVM